MIRSKIYTIAEREFKIRIIKKSFWIMTFLGPLIMAILMIVPLWSNMDLTPNETVVISSSDERLIDELPELPGINYIQNLTLNLPADSVVKIFDASSELKEVDGSTFEYRSAKSNRSLETIFEKTILAYHLKKKTNDYSLSFELKRKPINVENKGRGTKELLAYAMGIAVYFFIFMYGVQIMKGVVEEKTNRIIEVMLCTVKPFQLMMGKILGITAIGLVQFLLWIMLVIGLQGGLASKFQFEKFTDQNISQFASLDNIEIAYEVNAYLYALSEIEWGVVFIGFIWFFLIGFLLYAALFAVIGAASDADTDTQQFIFPLTVPLLSSVVLAQKMIADPSGTVANFMSNFPLTSPIAMPLRLPFSSEVNLFKFKLLMSSLILFGSFIIIVWIASRIYRIGIMTYGTKTNYKDLVTWFLRKNL